MRQLLFCPPIPLTHPHPLSPTELFCIAMELSGGERVGVGEWDGGTEKQLSHYFSYTISVFHPLGWDLGS